MSTKVKTMTKKFIQIAIVIMSIIFIMNLFLSKDYNLFWIVLSGGGNIIDHLGVSYETVFKDFQVYRLITYGYTQTAIWHLVANVFALWYIGKYLEKKIGVLKFWLVYHMGLIAAGILISLIYTTGFHFGASPAIFACFGVLVNWLVRDKELWKEYKTQKGFYFLLYYFVLSNLLGMPTLVIHLLGFGAGFGLGFVVKKK